MSDSVTIFRAAALAVRNPVSASLNRLFFSEQTLLWPAEEVNLKRFLKQSRTPKKKATAISQAIRVTAIYQLPEFATRLNSHQDAG
ncbi:hypothetical protein Osc7112_0914 [Oscillatoria nigro-viridis PCC 7112]|uniref:Uncharacterized protein n=1 Tax=Phormidium nigroviride PCC 7112 TaxID=179408 RepID=K9VDA9_9CYAN|nr:hypothetical protein [Oscillatoria nigro-viridis]AFZ05484.1 hypothetical protein Osc7112_0914 [Oscillatoria nigro-viridis PCC 7112]